MRAKARTTAKRKAVAKKAKKKKAKRAYRYPAYSG